MLTRVPEEIRRAEKAIDFGEFFSQEPLKFQFYYGENNQAEIINTIYLEDGNKPLTLYLEVFNDSEQDVIFKNSNSLAGKLATVQAGGAQAASEKKCHFQLRWEKDLGLKPSEIEIDGKSGQWQVNYDEESRFFSIYFLHKSGLTLKPNEKIQIGFSKLTANNRTVKSSNVELLYGGIGLISTGTANELIEEQVSSKNAVSVINHLRKTEIPLQFRVLGSNKILNDGTTQNTLKLKVLNSPLSNNTRPILLLDQSSKFIVSFEKGTHADALVATTDQLNGVQITVTDTNSWTSDHTANSTQWSFTPKINQLTAGQGIELTISNLVTNSASGLACIYIDYQNIGSYPDGRLVIPIEKTPLLYSGGQVGIGITNPVAKLDIQSENRKNQHPTAVNGLYVTGAFKADREGVEFRHSDGKQGIGFGYNTIYATGNDDNQDLGLKAKGKGKVKVDSPLWVVGNVGIGTSSPVAKLDIQSENRKNQHPTAVNGLYVTGAFKADREGVEFRHSDGKQGIGFGYNTIYATGNDDNQNLGLKAKGKGKVKVDSPLWVVGNVGIGTNDPKAKLHVNGGDAVISGKVGIGITNPKIHLAIGDDDTGLKQQGDGVLAIYTNGIEQVRVNASGNVGIGTVSPTAKLHVTGRIRLDDVPVWNGPAAYDVTWGDERDYRYNVICREGSSERYKQNIMPLEDDFQKILTLEPKAYQMKEGHGNEDEWQFGYIAEELDQLGLKSLVVYDRSGRPDGIQYKKMCIYLNEVLKNQQNYLERLENKVNELNQKLTTGQ